MSLLTKFQFTWQKSAETERETKREREGDKY